MNRGIAAAIRECLAGVAFILVPMCGDVDDVLAGAIQFGIITNDTFVVAALASEIGVACLVAELCEWGLVGSHKVSARQGVDIVDQTD